MSDFSTAVVQAKKLDHYRRVNYVHGLVLGVDEFLQEEAYLLEKDRLHNRTLHGYGTVCGLAVTSTDTSNGPRITVRSGIAVNPRGEEIRVPVDQCASINEWLLSNRNVVAEALGSPPLGPLQIYVVLCYRECSTERVPIPSGPCQSLEEASAPSRIADDFELQFTVEAPQRAEDQGIRDFITFMSQIRITASSPGLEEDELLTLLRDEFLPVQSPPIGPLPVVSPPGDYTVHPSVARERLRAAMRLWITEIRPTLGEEGKNCASGPPDENCVLLAQLSFDVGLNELGYFYNDTEVSIDEADRPYLLSSMLLQEQLLLEQMTDGGGGVTTHADLLGLQVAADHPQYLMHDGSRPLSQDWSIGGQRIMDLPLSGAPNDAIPRVELDNVFAAHTAVAADDHDLYLPRDGSRPMQANLNMNGSRVENIGTARRNFQDGLSMLQAQRELVQLEVSVPGPYHIIAGGRFRMSGDPIGPTYNGLQVRPAGVVNGMIRFRAIFDTYQNPDDPAATDAYVFKGMAEGASGQVIISLVEFQAGLFLFAVGPQNQDPTGFMLEISSIPTP